MKARLLNKARPLPWHKRHPKELLVVCGVLIGVALVLILKWITT
jgi:hypothetical protein